MGANAEAIERARKDRGDDTASRIGDAAEQMRKWSNWYGIAKPTTVGAAESAGDTGGAPGAIVEGMSDEIVAYYAPSSVRSEQYRTLRTRLISGNTRNENRVFAVTSAVPREGKSVTTTNLAFTLAEIPHLKVLIVDGDLRQGRIARMLNTKSSPGLADVLRGEAGIDDAVQPTPLPNLFVIPAGRTRGRSATELLSRKIARSVFTRFQREYQYTIVDTPPATTVADIGVIGQMTSGVLFVIRMHRTAEPIARHAIKHILGNNIKILGGLLIGENDPSSGYGRRYNYYPYYQDEHC